MKEPECICRVCGTSARYLWKGRLLDIAVNYFECDACRHVQTEKPYWLERVYTEAINASDTGIMARNFANARIALTTLWVLGALKGVVVDYAGGYGILVRLLRDYGIDALWSDRYCKNLLAKGFEYKNTPAALVTAFEVFEHLVNPADELSKMLAISPNVLISTELIPSTTPGQDEWWYYGKDHGQHIGFFRIETLRFLAQKNGKHLTTDGHYYHLFSNGPVSSIVWRTAIKANKLVFPFARSKLTSLTWSDHIKMASREENTIIH